MKYSENDASEQAEYALRKEELARTRARTDLRMRVPGLRYRDALRKNRLRTSVRSNYAERKADASNPCLRLSSFSTHSTKNS